MVLEVAVEGQDMVGRNTADGQDTLLGRVCKPGSRVYLSCYEQT